MADTWSDEELFDSLAEYLRLKKAERTGEHIVKAQVYRSLAAKHSRTTSSIERRMSNISFLMDLHGRQWVKGLMPLSNVGDRNIRQLEKFLAQIEGREPDPQIPVLANIQFRLRKKITEQPNGNQSPERKSTTSQYIERDPDVVIWVLQQANGICELCDEPAPFIRSDGTPYLEVHHIDPLGENGPDTVENAVALCPNCHKAVHYSRDRRELTEQIRLKVARIV